MTRYRPSTRLIFGAAYAIAMFALTVVAAGGTATGLFVGLALGVAGFSIGWLAAAAYLEGDPQKDDTGHDL